MKFVLSMIICSSVFQQCLPPHPMPDLYNSHYECLISGYNESIKKAKEIGPQEVNKYGTIIKFMCIDEALLLPQPKPGLES
jgi:hypothetical protein|tara:strand:+ start:220 stop:462 length:243 start_codon:yes stop_codon:yes gene_type:complete